MKSQTLVSNSFNKIVHHMESLGFVDTDEYNDLKPENIIYHLSRKQMGDNSFLICLAKYENATWSALFTNRRRNNNPNYVPISDLDLYKTTQEKRGTNYISIQFPLDYEYFPSSLNCLKHIIDNFDFLLQNKELISGSTFYPLSYNQKCFRFHPSQTNIFLTETHGLTSEIPSDE